MLQARPPLNNAEYRDSLSSGSATYPDWWGKNGGRLVPLESGIGTRVKLTAFYPLKLDPETTCDYWPQERDLTFDPSVFSWRLWVYGAYHEVTPRHCTEVQSFADFLFYAARGSSTPMPQVNFGSLVDSYPASEVTKDSVTVYIRRELTQKMNIGFFYLGVVVVEGSSGVGDISLPAGMSPADVVRSRPRIPPLWLFLQDASRNYHSRFENIPSGRGALCP